MLVLMDQNFPFFPHATLIVKYIIIGLQLLLKEESFK